MKRKVQILMCGLLMICASFICVACGKLNFESDKIKVTNTTYAYDGNAHIFNVSYEGVDVEVTYSLDNETFVSGKELGVKEVGTYKIYYKLTAEKYNDYIGEANLVINKSNFDESKITVSNKTYTYDGQKHMFNVECEEDGVTITYSLDGETYGNEYTVMKKEAGNYKIYYKISKEGYNDYIGEATLEIAKADFDATKISVVRTSQTYSGNKEIFEVNYPESTGITVLYSTHNENFVTFEQTNYVNAGTYVVYYKISNANYNDYKGQTTFVINKATLTEDKVSVTNDSVDYDGNSHMFDVVVDKVNATITYSLDNTTFVSKEELNLVNVGTHKVYVKVVNDNYVEYTFEHNMTINAIDLDESLINIGKTTLVYNGNKQIVDISVTGTDSTVVYSLDDYTYNNSPYLKDVGEYTLYYKVNVANYNEYKGSVKVVISGVKIARNNSSYATINEAMENAEAEDTLVLFGNAVVDSTLNITKTIYIDGQNKYAIKASDEFVGGNLISVATTTKTTLTLKDVTVDANSKARVIVVKNKNKLQILNANITGGYLANSYAPGVYITNEASFIMNGGSITGNRVADDYKDKDKYYVAYSLDLWIGANASGEGIEYQITKGTVGKMYINANSYSAKNPGKFTLTSGTIESIYLEYDSNYGAKLEYVNGTIGKLLVSTTTSGEYEEVTPVAGTTYKGGIETTTAKVATYSALVDALNGDKKIVKLTADIVVEEVLVVSRTVVLDMNGKTISNSTDLYDESKANWSLISVRENGNLKITGDGKIVAKENDCYCVDVQDGGNLTIIDGTYVGNISAIYSYEGNVVIKGGTYSIQQLNANGVESAYGATINIYNENGAKGTATVSITGGVFKNFDPAGRVDNPNDVLVADGYTAVLVKDSTTDYIVKKA